MNGYLGGKGGICPQSERNPGTTYALPFLNMDFCEFVFLGKILKNITQFTSIMYK
jgi:hypothetical protein